MSKVILDLCGGTGAWSEPYTEAGYNVINVTLPHHDVREYVSPKKVHGVLAAPPCTEFSLAKNNKPRDFRSGMKVVTACMTIVWECRIAGGLQWWAIENPRCFMRQFLGLPAFTFEQWEFGDAGIKPTDLWGYFKLPRTSVKTRPEGLAQRFPNGRINAKGWSKSATKRGVTPPGFARAFFEANQ